MKGYALVVIIVLLFIIVIAILVVRSIVKGKKSDGIKQLCDFVKVSLLTLQQAVVSAFGPAKPTGDVVISIFKKSFVILPKEYLTLDGLSTSGLLKGYACDPTLSMLNYRSTWDSIYLTSNVELDETYPLQPFHIFDTSWKYVVAVAGGYPACSNVFAEIRDINIKDFMIHAFSSTLELVALQSLEPTCVQLDDNTIQMYWDLSARSAPSITANMDCDVYVYSGYCGSDTFKFKCLHDRDHSPCPHLQVQFDNGSVHADVSVQSSIYFNFRLRFQVGVDIRKRLLHVREISVELKEWDVTNVVNIQTIHHGLKVIKFFSPIEDLIDVTPLSDAIKENVASVLGRWVPDTFKTINEYLGKQQIDIPFKL